MRSACCNSIPLFRTSDEECCPRVLSFFMTMLGRILQLQQRDSWSVFDGKCLITHHHPPGLVSLWFSSPSSYETVVGQHFGTMSCRAARSVENWLKAQAAGFYDEGIGKLVPRYEKCLRRGSERRLCREVVCICDNVANKIFLTFTVVLMSRPIWPWKKLPTYIMKLFQYSVIH